MCEFKYCRGTGTCFLSKTSPCTGFEASSPSKDRPRSIRMRYDGFLDQDTLLDVLEPSTARNNNIKPAEEKPSGLSGIVAAAPRFLRRKSDKGADQKNSAA